MTAARVGHAILAGPVSTFGAGSPADASLRGFWRPPVLALGALSIATLGYTFYLVTHDISLLRPGQERWVGAGNLWRVLTDPRAQGALWRTLLYVAGAVAVQVTLGVALALFFDRPFFGRRLVRVLLVLPLMVTPVVVGLSWRVLYDPNIGFINYLLWELGVPAQPDWLGSVELALLAVLAADTWQWTPFVALLTMAALDAMPREPIEAARIDGARGDQILRFVVLPMLRRTILIALVLRVIDSIKAFDLIYIMTRGGPAQATETLNMYAYIAAFKTFDVSYAAALALVLTLATNLVFLFLYRAVREGSP